MWHLRQIWWNSLQVFPSSLQECHEQTTMNYEVSGCSCPCWNLTKWLSHMPKEERSIRFPPGSSPLATGRHAVKPLYLDRQGVGHDAIHRVFCEGVKVFVWSSHELRLQSVAAPPIVFKHEEIQLHGQIWNERAKIKTGVREKSLHSFSWCRRLTDGLPGDKDNVVLWKTNCA